MIEIPSQLRELAKVFPCPLYVVGGFVRNNLMRGDRFSRLDTDIDLAGSILPKDLKLPPQYTVVEVNPRLGTAVIRLRGGEPYEYTPLRTEKYPEGGAHTPSEVDFTDSVYLDTLRRDFTINSIYYDISNDKLIDFFDGAADVRRGIIRAVDNAQNVFSNDGLRIMRLVRQSAETGFEIAPDTFDAAHRLRHLLKDISKERIRMELDKILAADQKYGVADGHYRGLNLIGQLGIWQYIIPEVEDMIDCLQNPKYHRYDVYGHSLECARVLEPHLRLAGLLHDIGKPASIKQIGKMYNHPELGGQIVRRVLGEGGLKYPNAIIRHTVRLVEAHMYDRDGNTRKTKMRRFVAKNHDIIVDLVKLIRADAYAKGFNGTENEQPPHCDRFLSTLQDMKTNNIPLSIAELKINGSDLIGLGFAGTEIGAELKRLFEAALCGQIKNERAILLREAKRCRQK